MDIINGGRALMNIRHKLNILIKNKRNLDFNIDDAEISYLSKGRTNDSYLLDFNNFKVCSNVKLPEQANAEYSPRE